MHPHTHRMMDLFKGYMHAYGIYNITDETNAEGKRLGNAATKRMPITTELWDAHLKGEQGLGIIPINEDNEVKFGVIDVDQYNVDLINLNKRLVDEKLPVVLFRSKSGGAHIYVFFDKFVSAKTVQVKLKELAAYLGYGNSEVYPKQTKVLAERGDIGQWINIPYFDAESTMRYAFGPDHKALKIGKFLEYVSGLVIPLSKLTDLELAGSDVILRDGPPCLQHLATQGFPKGTRNKGLFNLGVYALKSNPDGFKDDLDKYNKQYMTPPLPSSEVLGVIKSLQKKEYNYTCKEEPICGFCNSTICRARKYGVGTGKNMPVLSSLTKLNTQPPVWFIEVEDGGRIEVSTDDLQHPLKFQKRCMDVLNIMPDVVKREVWQAVVQELLGNVNVVDMPVDASPAGQLIEHLETFCTNRAASTEQDGLLTGKPWKYDNRIYFRIRDFLAFLDRVKFTYFKQHKIIAILKENGAKHKAFNIKGRCVNTWHIPEFVRMVGQYEKPIQTDEEVI